MINISLCSSPERFLQKREIELFLNQLKEQEKEEEDLDEDKFLFNEFNK